MEDNVNSEAYLLRQKAEKLLKNRPQSRISNSNEGEILKLLHELEVYSVELELQNEELLSANQQAEEASANKFSENVKQQIIHEFELNQIMLEMQYEELKFSSAISKDVVERYSDLFNFSASGYLILSKEGEILDLNYTGARLLGKDRFKLKNSLFGFFVTDEEKPIYNDFLRVVFNTKSKTTCEVSLLLEDSKSIHVQLTGIITQNGVQCLLTLVDITERKETIEYREITREILQILNEPGDVHEAIHQIVSVLKTRIGLDAVGFRLQVGNDFPYLGQIGFPEDFMLTENTLIEKDKNGEVCRDENGNVLLGCICGLVLSGKTGKTDSADIFVSPSGSWWTNNLMPISDKSAHSDGLYHPRYKCSLFHFSSIALVPIRNNDKIVGLIQLNDKRKDRFNIHKIELYEEMASHIGTALMRVQAEETLRKNEELLRTITENAPDIIIQLDQNGTILYMNRTLSGYDREDCIGKNFCIWTSPEYHALMNESLQLVFNNSISQTYLSQGMGMHGELRWYRTNIAPVKEGDTVKNAIMITRDITESIESDRMLRENEEKKNAIISTTMDGFWITDQQGCFHEVNDAYCRMTGYTRQELLSMRIQDIEAIEDDTDTSSRIKRIMENGEDHFETRHRRKDGSLMDIESSVRYRPVNGGQFVSFLHDITKQKLSEESLRQSDERYKSLFQDNYSVLLLLNPDSGDILDANPAACSYYGWSHDELCHKTIFEIDPRPKEETLFKLQQSKEVRNNHLFVQHQLAHGEIREVEVYSGPILVDDSTMLYTIIHDVTESKLAQEALRLNEERYSLIYNSSRDSIFSIDTSGRFTAANKSFCKKINRELPDLIGHALSELGLPEPVCMELDNLQRKVIETNNSIISEMEIPLADEEIRYYEVVLNPLHDINGGIVGFGVSIRNITKRKKANQALIESEKRFRDLVKDMPVGIILYGPHSEVITSNPKALELLGINEENQLIVNSLIEAGCNAFHEDGSTFPYPERPVPQTFATGQSVSDVIMGVYRPATSDFIWILLDTEIILKNDGSIQNVVCSFIDVTKLKKAENELRENEQRLKYHFENSPLAIVELDNDHLITQWSLEAEHIFGWEKEETIGKTLDSLNLIFEEDILLVKETMKPLYNGEKDTIVSYNRNVTKSGDIIECAWYNSILFGQDGQMESVMSLVQDVTSRKKAELALKQLNEELEERVRERTGELQESNEALKITQEKYRTVADFATDWEFWIDPDDRILYCSPSCERITGYKSTEFDQNSQLIFDIIHPSDLQLFQKHKKEEVQAKFCDREIQYRIIRKDGTIRWIGHLCQPVFDESGNFKGIRGSNKDITARKKMEELLTTSNQKYKLLSENISDGVFLFKSGRFEYINDAICDIFGYTRSELKHLKLTQIVMADYYKELKKFLNTDTLVNQSCILEVECLKKDRSVVFVELLLNYIAKEKVVYGVVHDNTEKRLLQKNILKAIIQTEEKERSHFSKELHDGLGPLLSTIKLYLQWSERPGSKKSRVEIIGKAGEILEEALTTVKEISNKLSPHLLMNYGLSSAIKSFVEKLNATSTYNIVFECNTQRRIGAETEAAIYRAVIECINNTMKYAQANNIYIILKDSGTQIQLQYKDDGIGFDISETLAKQKGLGLFNLQNRLHTIGGKVDLYSEPGKGVNYVFTVDV